ncbi:MAG TPA: thiamine phosphate synthase [Prosthecochloris aestuarii]|uniref:Thiamine-phosphate synthase n=1 Tax=Prosthecochloris aestuarii TaxID=1102 RepID=A0A831SV06_PROAE|nr:thiamine phosphate synthase [Prosthecochloris aestuarii]
MNHLLPLVCFITPEEGNLVEQAVNALKGGARMIQLRRKHASGHELYSWAVTLQQLCREFDAIFIVNDRVDIAMAMNADGVHIGQEDLPLEKARKLLPSPVLIGCSASTIAEALKAEREGADYVGFGHIFETISKKKEHSPCGTELLRKVTSRLKLPVIAIGGISAMNARDVMDSGAAGIAVISAISSAENPELAAKKLTACIRI